VSVGAGVIVSRQRRRERREVPTTLRVVYADDDTHLEADVSAIQDAVRFGDGPYAHLLSLNGISFASNPSLAWST